MPGNILKVWVKSSSHWTLVYSLAEIPDFPKIPDMSELQGFMSHDGRDIKIFPS